MYVESLQMQMSITAEQNVLQVLLNCASDLFQEDKSALMLFPLDGIRHTAWDT